jgi:hypothetical protein
LHEKSHDMRGHGDDEFDDGDAIAKTGPSHAKLLIATGSWQSLPRHMRLLMDDAMEHVDGDHAAEPKSAPTYDQARSTATDADADADAAPVGVRVPKSMKKLNKAAALAIFQAKRCNKGSRSRSSLSATLGRRYGTTAKTVRDVWNGRTWANVTKPFWTAEDKKKFEGKEKKFEGRKMQACSDHLTPYPTPITTLPMHLPSACSLWWPRVDRA